MDFALIDESQGAATANGETISPAALTRAAAILTFYLNRDVARWWGGLHRVRMATGSDLVAGEIACVSRPILPDAPDAIAYHTINGVGVPSAVDAVPLSDSLFGPGNSWLVAWSHEMAETVGDAPCNAWRDDGQGTEHSQELCDPVEEQSYRVTTAAGFEGYVSNFVLPAYFTPGAPGPYDFLTTLGMSASSPQAPFGTTTGGYQIVRTASTDEHQLTALLASRGARLLGFPLKARIAKKSHWSSRTFRRGVRLAG